MHPKLERILPRVQKPARYTGGEYGQILKDKTQVDLRLAFCFPDTYEIGMSNLGMRILYGVFNSIEGLWCERVFAPWGDMEAEMRANGIPLYGLESGDPIGDFDAIAFTLGYEMAYTTVLNMLDLAGLPLRAAERTALTPLVFAGGACVYNAEPLCDFIDLFSIGEGEESSRELAALLKKAKQENWDKPRFLRAAAQLPGIYVPSLYTVDYHEDGTVAAITPRDGAPMPVVKRIVQDLEHSYMPEKPIVPSTEIVHDRVTIELFRGCIRACRFCQAGYVYRPVRRRSAGRLVQQGIRELEETGYQEITLSSLSTSDYKELNGLCDGLLDWCKPHMTGLSLPSLRADNFSMELMEKVQQVRKSGLTFAPEAGSQRLRDAINKNVTEEDLLNTCRIAFEGGWNSVKLYFMLGLPTETDEDVVAIADLAYKVLGAWKRHAANKSRGVRITVSTSCFVPKPHTPFQWEAQNSMEEFRRKQQLLQDAMKTRAITYNWHDPDTSLVEAVLARGDRRLGAVLESVWKKGGRLEAWSEYFRLDRWLEALEEQGLTAAFYANRERPVGECLPWSMIGTGVDERYLAGERAEAYESHITPDCRVKCTGCGAIRLLKGGCCDA